ncbi:hypothetical protein GCM10027598_80930 [Amycolatopsis oliviviridis]|uniref:DUF397 domain-containing protein n=1 Tax=Amycolatopsis oliviviridis TaxID=1471590 RepID=A0ABQ3L7Y5_9PSEU|nr:DUF397 domain-containing protein [Amycolatopsis oliviviridis]GHH06043.1 hypothetical protein GCM10017790_10820 [Amycolatopsis oliviviridis]
MSTDSPRPTLNTAYGWWKSSYSNGASGCVEFNASVPGYVGVRDSKLGDKSPVLVFKPREIRAFLTTLTNGTDAP